MDYSSELLLHSIASKLTKLHCHVLLTSPVLHKRISPCTTIKGIVCYCFLTGMKTGAQTMLRFNACASLEPTCAGGYRTANAISTNSYIRSARVVSRLILFLCLCFFVCTLFGYFFVTGANFGECFVLFYCLFLVTIKILTFSKDIKILLMLAWL